MSVELAPTGDDHDDDEPADPDTTDLDLLYAPAEGLAREALRGVLHGIAKQGHSRLSYAEVRRARSTSPTRTPPTPDNVILLYTIRRS